MAVDYGLFQALTGPMQASNTIQQDRDAQRIRALQLQEQEYQLLDNERKRQEALQQQLNLAAQSANKAIFNNGTFVPHVAKRQSGTYHKQINSIKCN